MFHMTNCGLPNVWLQSGYKTGTDKFGPFYSIVDLPGLYRAIALALAHGAGQLSADELRVIRRQLELTQAQLGAALGRTEQTVLLWERGGKIPADSAKTVKLMILRHFSPRITIEDAFQHLEQRKPARIVLARTQNQWECVLACRDPVLEATYDSEWNVADFQFEVGAMWPPQKVDKYLLTLAVAIEREEESKTWTMQ
jgi:DNA-binding XRE family transcriptional regulator